MSERRSSSRASSVTVKQVAAAAGVSWKTVTNVVHGHPNVRPETRQRVLDAISELGYRPSIAGRQLRRGRTTTLALIVPDILNSYFAELMLEVFAAADRRGYGLFVEPLAYGGEAARTERAAASAAARFAFDGMLISPSFSTSAELAELAERVPVVLLGEGGGRPSIDRVCIDNVAAAEEVTNHLVALGRRHIAFVGRRRLPAEPARSRLRGYQRALDAAGLEPPTGPTTQLSEYDAINGERVVAELLANGVRFDAVVCANDMLAMGAIRALAGAGRRVPDDVAVSGWDNTVAAAALYPSLTSIDPHIDEIAATAVDLLIARIDGDDGRRRTHVIGHHLVTRESSGVHVHG